MCLISIAHPLQLLSRLDTISSSQVISLVLSTSEVQGSMERSEIMDRSFACLFGLVSVIQSRLLYRETSLPTSPSHKLASSLSDFQTVWRELIALGMKKSWLRESCWWALGLSLDGFQAHGSVPWKTDAIQWIIDAVFEAKESNLPSIPWTPDKLAITLKVMHLAPSANWKSLLVPTFKDGHPLALTNLTNFGRILRVRSIQIYQDTFRYVLSYRKLLRRGLIQPLKGRVSLTGNLNCISFGR